MEYIGGQPQLSIIVPVYNAAEYVADCLRSIDRQTFDDFEVIVVDDGSTDGSFDIVNDYIKDDDRYHLFRQENQGPSKARNKGIDMSRGKWILFVDADDVLEEDSLRIIDLYNKSCDILFFGFRLWKENYIRDVNLEFILTNNIDKIDNILSKYLVGKDMVFGYTWNKLFRRDIIERYNIRFEEGLRYKEDEVFTFNYICHCKSLSSIPDVLYHYRILEKSLSHGMRVNKQGFELNRLLLKLINISPYVELNKAFITRMWDQYVYELMYEPHFVPTKKVIDGYKLVRSVSRDHKISIRRAMAKTMALPWARVAVMINCLYYRLVAHRRLPKYNIE